MSGLASIEQLIEPTLNDMGFELVRAQMVGKDSSTLQIMAERRGGEGAEPETMTVADCAKISRAISAILDVEDPIKGTYTLEVSSPGLDRPLVRERDFTRFAGSTAKVEMAHAIDGQRRFKGLLNGIDGGMVKMEVDGKSIDLPLDDVVRAKLVITDEMLAAAKQQGR
jgi:ribosome maturation factor RimP